VLAPAECAVIAFRANVVREARDYTLELRM